jgi:glutamate/tyrosine decarboxylase-like PLP-dependent enzyme
VDPIAQLAALAAAHGAGCHVDACIGGFVLPFLERLGHHVPVWDFRVDGVTEISADVHKYGYAPKGASVILHRDPDWFAHQVFLFDQWPSGLYGSPAMAGARPAAPIATAWAVINYLGIGGYTEMMRGLMETAAKVRAGIRAIDGLEIVGDPIGPVLSFRSDAVDLDAVADVMDDRNWNLNRNTDPRGLHLMLSPAHAAVADDLLADLRHAVGHHGESRGVEARYS